MPFPYITSGEEWIGFIVGSVSTSPHYPHQLPTKFQTRIFFCSREIKYKMGVTSAFGVIFFPHDAWGKCVSVEIGKYTAE